MPSVAECRCTQFKCRQICDKFPVDSSFGSHRRRRICVSFASFYLHGCCRVCSLSVVTVLTWQDLSVSDVWMVWEFKSPLSIRLCLSFCCYGKEMFLFLFFSYTTKYVLLPQNAPKCVLRPGSVGTARHRKPTALHQVV